MDSKGQIHIDQELNTSQNQPVAGPNESSRQTSTVINQSKMASFPLKDSNLDSMKHQSTDSFGDSITKIRKDTVILPLNTAQYHIAQIDSNKLSESMDTHPLNSI